MTQSNLGDNQSLLHEAQVSLLKRYFQLSVTDAAAVAKKLKTVHLVGGQTLFQQGDETDSMYLLVRGRLQVWIDAEPPVFIGEVSPGESVGEVGLLTGERRSADVLATRHSVLIKINREDFEHLAGEHPAMVMQLASVVAKRLHENTTGINNKNRPAPSIICLRPLDDTLKTRELTDLVIKALSEHGDLLMLSIEEMTRKAVPHCPRDEQQPLTEAFYHWFSEQEANHRFIVLSCRPSSSQWSEFAENQSDLVLLLAEASSDPRLRKFESSKAKQQKHIKHNVLLLHHESTEISGTKTWLSHRAIDYHLHLRGDAQADIARVGRILSGNANGLVLGGGAARGFSHVGTYRALHEANIPIDWIGGTSIGAIMGVAIAMFETPALIEEKVKAAFVGGRPFGDFTLPLVSILAGQRMNTLTRKYMPGDIEDLAIPFFAISSDISTGSINVHESGPIWRATGASAALPGVLPPMIYRHSLAVDGAVLNNLPVDVMSEKPIGTIYAAVLSSRDEYEISFDDVPSPWQILLDRLLPAGNKRHIPGLAALLFKATEVANRKRTRDLAESADVLFKPPVQDFNLLSVDHFDDVVKAGYEHAKAVLGTTSTQD
jgi:predicted acylesterase/phospholipase RssA/CRP-like cAMP-binding protein